MPIVQFSAPNPLVDGRQSDTALAIRRGLARHFEQMGMVVLAEFPLRNGRRADLLAMDAKGRFSLIEIKSSIADFRADSKWPNYHDYCDRFYFATAPSVPATIFPADQGLWVADRFAADLVREATVLSMAPATRRALTLRFARLAAQRLERVLAYGAEAGLDLPAADDL